FFFFLISFIFFSSSLPFSTIYLATFYANVSTLITIIVFIWFLQSQKSQALYLLSKDSISIGYQRYVWLINSNLPSLPSIRSKPIYWM
ncbi:hypothetical protein BC943DRAFT_328313, partial [Umbelopsis sp. AD052]